MQAHRCRVGWCAAQYSIRHEPAWTAKGDKRSFEHSTDTRMGIGCRRHDQAVQHAGDGIQVVLETGYGPAQTGESASSCIAAGFVAVATLRINCVWHLECIMCVGATQLSISLAPREHTTLVLSHLWLCIKCFQGKWSSIVFIRFGVCCRPLPPPCLVASAGPHTQVPPMGHRDWCCAAGAGLQEAAVLMLWQAWLRHASCQGSVK